MRRGRRLEAAAGVIWTEESAVARHQPRGGGRTSIHSYKLPKLVRAKCEKLSTEWAFVLTPKQEKKGSRLNRPAAYIKT